MKRFLPPVDLLARLRVWGLNFIVICMLPSFIVAAGPNPSFFSVELSAAIAGMSFASLIDLNEADHSTRSRWSQKQARYFRFVGVLLLMTLIACLIEIALQISCGKSIFRAVGWALVPIALIPSFAGEIVVALVQRQANTDG